MNETSERDAPIEDASPARRSRGGCLIPLLILAGVAVALFFIIGFIFDEGANAPQPLHGFDAGPASAFQPGTINQFDVAHVFLTRLRDGSFVALYDKSPRQQELGGDCRLHYDDHTQLGPLPQVDGFTGALVEDCEGQSRSVWRADGEFAFGAAYGHLDTYKTSINANGDLIVDTDMRTCTRSRGASGVPPYDVLRCGRGD